MTTSSDQTIVLVTGANQGIGFEISKMLATEQSNYHIIMAGRRKDAIEEAARTLVAQNLSVEPLVLDLNSDESIAAAAKAVGDKHGHIHVLVNNAAISTAPTASARDEFVRVLDTNVVGVQAVTEAFIPLLEAAPRAATKRIVFLGSALGSLAAKADPAGPTRALPWIPYTVSKTAGHMLALCYAARFDGRDDWKVNVTCPGLCATNLNDFASAGGTAESGAVNACRLATLGPDGPTNTFTNKEGTVAW